MSTKSEVIHVTSLDELSKDIGNLCLSETCADVYFLVEDERIPGHRAILGNRSEFFRALLFGNMSESSKHEIVLPNLSAGPFKMLLKFIYSGKLSLSPDHAFDLLEVANQFSVVPVEDAISCYIQKNITLENIVDALNAACLYSIRPLQDKCIDFVHENIRNILSDESFQSFSKMAMEVIIKGPIYVPDKILYNAILSWSSSQEDSFKKDISTYLENHCLSPENKGIFIDLGSEKDVNYFQMKLFSRNSKEAYSYSIDVSSDKVSWTTIINSKEYPENVKSFCFPTKRVRYVNLMETQGQLMIASFKLYFLPNIPMLETNLIHPSDNVASAEMGASANHNELLNGNMTEYGGMHGFAAHDIPNQEFLLVQLGRPYLIDSLRLLLWDHNRRYYHYYIDCSLDKEHWTRIVDKTKEKSRSWQNFVFDPTPMMYIKIAGTYNTENRWFHCVHFECPSQDRANAVRL